MQKKRAESFFRKFWNLLWKDESLKGWIFSIIFLFVFIKFIFFPVLNLATGTELPLAIVESCSMYHKGNVFSNFDNWWGKHDSKYSVFSIDQNKFSDFTFRRGFSKGDILFIIRAKPEKLEVGDVIIFDARPNYPNPLIHRIINIKQEDGNFVFSTIGDNNNGQLSVEKEIPEDTLVGKAVFRIAPFIGWGKLIFYDWRNPLSERGFCEEN
ncbi:MAG: signal peptidase I [Nanoarchaeota archaeon]|nr:signal peptidase I [Nanoarchaeota archaeon]